jgi:putative oxidoreductase
MTATGQVNAINLSRSQTGRKLVVSRSEDFALLLGRLFVAALFLPSGFNKLMAFSTFTASLAAKGLPYPAVIAGVMVAAEFLGPLALLIGLWPRWTALALIGFTGANLWMTYGQSGLNMLLRPQQNVELFERLAITGGLLFYFSSGPGGCSRTSLK